ncbi:MAG TPA: GDSL-type esterase/lipase family protein [Candidatus Paceibacterota bacterium]
MRIIIFGDSITQGFFDTSCGGWANRLHTYVMTQVAHDLTPENLPHVSDVFQLGIGGDTIARLAERFDVEFVRRRRKDGKTLTIFALGVNDSKTMPDGTYRTPINDFKAHYTQIIHEAKNAGPVMLIGLAPIDEERLNPAPWDRAYGFPEGSRALFDTAVQELAREHGCTFISMDGVFGDDVAGRTTDGIHPNAEGHQLMFERIRDALVKEDLL